MIRDTLSYKGIEQFDYLVATQQDTLIDKDRLAEGVLKMHEKLGLLLDEEEQQTNASHLINKLAMLILHRMMEKISGKFI